MQKFNLKISWMNRNWHLHCFWIPSNYSNTEAKLECFFFSQHQHPTTKISACTAERWRFIQLPHPIFVGVAKLNAFAWVVGVYSHWAWFDLGVCLGGWEQWGGVSFLTKGQEKWASLMAAKLLWSWTPLSDSRGSLSWRRKWLTMEAWSLLLSQRRFVKLADNVLSTLTSWSCLQTTHLVVNNAEKAQDSYKSRIAQKWGVPVVSVDFIHACVDRGKLLEVDPYLVVGKTAAQEFSSGKIIGKNRGKMKM